MTEIVLALDQGSGSSRVLAFDSRGRVVARSQFPVKTFYPRSGWVEHDAEDLARSLERALDAALAKLPRSARILGAGLACQRSTVVLWDLDAGKPVCRAPSWQDGRAAGLVGSLAASRADAHERTGLYLAPYYSAPKLRWLLDKEPKARAALERGSLRAGPVSSWLLWRLTRGEVCAVDPSMAQRTLLFNIRALDWDPVMLDLFGIQRSLLPAVRPSAGEWGVIRREGRNFPILAVLGDQQAAALGLGGDAPGSGVLNYGTGAFFLLNTGAEQRRIPGLLTSVAWQKQGRPCQYFQEGAVHAAGSSLHWLRENLGLLKRVENADAACRRSKNRVLALQAIGGLGAPRWDYSTFTTYMGLSSQTRPEDLVRAVAEGIAFLLADIVAAARPAGPPLAALRASGGLSRMDYLLGFQADLLQAPILRVAEREATAAGAASLAAEAAGAPWAGALKAGARGRLFEPRMSTERAAKLKEGWRLFVETQQRLSVELRRLGVLS